MADEVNKPDIDNETSNFRNTTLAALARLKEQNQALTNEANKNKAATLAYNRAQKKKKRREALSAKITNVKGLEGLQTLQGLAGTNKKTVKKNEENV